ncbi:MULTISPECIES: cytochrome c [Rhodopseudomonas]|nr:MULTISPECIES: cytochrome c [Rhodopseudomonas]MDF3811303.1 cytochrome c [Rhodopseudomonas sp. BAL398]WOK18629.1 cytochrome c [Rhodopseudomonas sp. BAL398]
MMRSSLAVAALLAVVAAPAAAQDSQSFDRIERGRALAVLGDCGGCHTAPGGKPFAGGLPLATPFGTIVAANITPDRQTGIGNMTDAEFLSALREGRGQGGKRLYPAMPYPAYTKMTDDDVLAIRAYLATVEPVSNAVVSNQLPFPLNIRLAMLGWNWLNFTPGHYRPDPHKSAEWNRGAYIVQGPAHCGTCHTPKTLLGGDKAAAALAGGTLQGWYAPNLTNDPRSGIGNWTKDEVVQYLKTGSNSWTLASGPMAEAIRHSTSHMPDADIAAIATYLKDSGLGAVKAAPVAVAASNNAMRAGAAIFKDSCAVCHKDDGIGEAHLFPRLAGSALVQSEDPTTLTRLVLHGSRAVATATKPTGPAMPAFDWRLNDAQVAAVLTYIRNQWGNAAAPVTASNVAKQRRSLASAP